MFRQNSTSVLGHMGFKYLFSHTMKFSGSIIVTKWIKDQEINEKLLLSSRWISWSSRETKNGQGFGAMSEGGVQIEVRQQVIRAKSET